MTGGIKPVVTVAIRPHSDGNANKWPDDDNERGLYPVDDIIYRTTIGTKWMEYRKQAQPRVSYRIDRLPAGYRLYGRHRENQPKHVDQYLYGHPKSSYRSAVEFFDHFVSLMNGDTSKCTCKGCKPSRGRPVGSNLKVKSSGTPTHRPTRVSAVVTQSARSTPRTKPASPAASSEGPLPPAPRYLVSPPPETEEVDEEGTQDIWRALGNQLEAEGELDKAIEEPDSIDWLVERDKLPAHIASMERKPRWMPRIGEIVLYARNVGEHELLGFDKDEQLWKVRNAVTGTNVADPQWQAGIVVQVSDSATIKNLTSGGKADGTPVNVSGFRVEPMPEIGNSEKPWSKRPSYLPLHHIRPLALWREYLGKAPIDEQHPTIVHALSASASFSLLQKFHIKGTHPNATVFCKGIYIGAELILVGDTVRLLPPRHEKSSVTDVLQVTSIKLKLINVHEAAVIDDLNQIPPEFNSCVHISGHGYTTDATRGWGTGKVPLTQDKLPNGLSLYGSWFNLHGPEDRLDMPFMRVMGRCFEDEAVGRWLPPTKGPFGPTSSFVAINNRSQDKQAAGVPMLDYGLEGCKEARTFATTRDPRILKADGKTWFWADDRVEQLDLAVLLGQEVGKYSHYGDDVSTEPRQAAHLDAMKRAKRARDRGLFPTSRGRGRPRGRGGRSGLTHKFAASAMVDSAANVVDTEHDDDEDDGDVEADDAMDVDEGNGSSRKRRRESASSGDELARSSKRVSAEAEDDRLIYSRHMPLRGMTASSLIRWLKKERMENERRAQRGKEQVSR